MATRRLAALLQLSALAGASALVSPSCTRRVTARPALAPVARSWPGGQPLLRANPRAAGARMASPPVIAMGSLRTTVLFWSLLPMVAVVTSCLAAMVPTAYRAFYKYREQGNPKRTLARRVFTGCMLGATVSMWIFSGTYAFLAVFVWMAVVAQNEYYFMARENGCYPTWKLGTLGSISMYVAAASGRAALQDAMLPLTGCICIVYLLLRQEKATPPTTMNDVSTTFMGIWYLGYMPSFWVRLRTIAPLPASEVASLFLPAGAAAAARAAAARAPAWLAAAAARADLFTQGAIVQWRRPHVTRVLSTALAVPSTAPRAVPHADVEVHGPGPPHGCTGARAGRAVPGAPCRARRAGRAPRRHTAVPRAALAVLATHCASSPAAAARWTMLAIVVADIAAYFGGKRWGRTPLIKVSPNKTWEGLWSGVAGCIAVMVLGAALMRWPLPPLSGALYGALCCLMALIGDLTVSLLKRSAGVKDTGALLPGHGGLLDRIDSYLLVAAPAYFFVRSGLPAIARLAA